MSEHPHDCSPECSWCATDDAWEALCDELDCVAPVFLGSALLGWRACGRCQRCGGVA